MLATYNYQVAALLSNATFYQITLDRLLPFVAPIAILLVGPNSIKTSKDSEKSTLCC